MNSLRIMAIGGGKLKEHVGELLRQSVDMVEAEKSPRVLVIPTARPTQEAFDKSIAQYGGFFKDTLGLPTEVLHDFGTMPTRSELEEKIEAADLIYINGGDTDNMMNIWREHGVDDMVTSRAIGGTVLSGVSAGAIAPFSWGHSDSMHYRVDEGEPWSYMAVPGLNLIHAGVTPHHNTTPTDQPRSEMFRDMFAAEAENYRTAIGFGIDNDAAIRIVDGKLQMVRAHVGANVVMLAMHSGNVLAEPLIPSDRILVSSLTA